MSIEALVVLVLLLAAVCLFVSEILPLGVIAVSIAATLMLTGVLTPREGLSGFSNPATVTIGAMFVLSEGVRRTGALETVGELFLTVGKRRAKTALTVMMLTVGVISAFINNTAAIAIFIPVVLTVAAEMRISPSKLLMPVSFASMFGGTCTLIGTSTNILVSSIAERNGMNGFGMFEFTPLGVIFFAVGFLYMVTAGIRLIPQRRKPRQRTANYGVNAYLTDVVIEENNAHIGDVYRETRMLEDLDLDLIHVFRNGDRQAEQENLRLREGDVLRIRGSAKEINELVMREDMRVKTTGTWTDADLERGSHVLVEAVVAPDGALEHRRARSIDLHERFGAVALAIQHRGELRQEDIGDVRLHAGDCLLLAMPADRVESLQQDPSIVLATPVPLPRYRREKMGVALAVLAGVVAATALDLAPVVVNALVGAVVMVVAGCITNEEGYQAVNWQVILLLAGVIPLGLALDKTGVAGTMADWIVETLGRWGPHAVLGGFLMTTILLTAIMNNQASAALLAPMVIQAAGGMGADPRPFLMAVTFGASLSFMTPVGYQTNTLVYGAGHYAFTDFTKVGAGLNLIFWCIGTVMIPVIWPF